MAHTLVFPRAQLTVGGQSHTVFEAQATSGIRSPFATVSARVVPSGSAFRGDEAVRLDLGYLAAASVRSVGAGTLNQDTVKYGPQTVSFTAVGPLGRTQEPTGIEDASLANPDPTLPPTNERFAKGWVDTTDGAIVADILALYGITDVTIADSGTRFATLAPSPGSRYAVRLRSDEPGWTLIQELDKLTGYRTFDGPDGRVTRLPASGLPSGSPARTFTQGADFKGSDATRQRSSDGVSNRVTVTGQSGILADGTPYAIGVTVDAPSPYVPTPPGYRETAIQSDLIETYDLASAIATRTLGEVNRRVETVTLPLARGDSGLYPGMTVAVVSDALGLTAANLYRVVEAQHTYGAQGYQTTLTLQGGAASEGTDPNQAPLAAIDYALEIEGLANGDEVVIAALDGSGSHDPDGAIVAYAWSGTPVAPTPLGTGSAASAVYNPFPATPPTVTLTVTDDHGRTGSATRAITKAAGKAYTRDLWYCDGTLHFSADQKTWRDYATAAIVIPEQAGDDYTLAASAAGVLARVLRDGTATAPSGPTGVTALTISRDRTGAETGVAWAAASDGRVWRSVDRGVSWAAVAALPNSGRCDAIEESPYSPGDLYAGGGNVLWHSYGAGASWEAFFTHPNPALIVARLASGVAAGTDAGVGTPVGWIAYGGPVGAAGEAARVRERGGALAHPLPSGQATPFSGTALTISLDAARLFLADDGDGGRVFTAVAGASGDLVPSTGYDRAIVGTIRHAIRDGRFPIVWLATAKGVWKSADEGATFLNVKDAPGATMVAYGALRAQVAPTVARGSLIMSVQPNGAAPAQIVALTAAGWVSLASPHPCAGLAGEYVLRASGATLFTYARTGTGNDTSTYQHGGTTNAFRSTDGGTTWTPLTIGRVNHIAPGPGGVVYAGWRTGDNPRADQVKLAKSLDNGATWAELFSWTTGEFIEGPIASLVVDPTDANRLYLHGRVAGGSVNWPALIRSIDGGATFAATGIVPADYANLATGGHHVATRLGGAYLFQDSSPFAAGLRRLLTPAGGAVSEATAIAGVAASPWFARDAANDFHYGGGGVSRSTDEGATWTAVYDAARSAITTGDHANSFAIHAFVPGDAANDWYVAHDLGIVLARRPALAEPGTPWESADAALAAAFPAGNYRPYTEGMVRGVAP